MNYSGTGYGKGCCFCMLKTGFLNNWTERLLETHSNSPIIRTLIVENSAKPVEKNIESDLNLSRWEVGALDSQC